MSTLSLSVQAPTQQGFANNPWMVQLDFPFVTRPEHRTLFRDNILSLWCLDNCVGEWWIVKTKYAYFRLHDDSMMFYLRFK